MGVMIHVIAEIFKNGKWQQIDEYPESIQQSGYREYALLAGVRDGFKQQLFDVKGLPADLDKPYARWESRYDFYCNRYETSGTDMLVFNNPDGSKTYEQSFAYDTEIQIDEAFYNRLHEKNDEPTRYYWLSMRVNGTNGTREFFVHDAKVVGAKYMNVPYKTLYSTLQEYLDAEQQEEWSDITKDYGSFGIDFNDECYFNHSYLTLEELMNADYTKYHSICYKLDREFYDMFIAHGGVLPDCFTTSESGVGSLIDAMHEAVEPTITISWSRKQEDIDSMYMTKGII